LPQIAGSANPDAATPEPGDGVCAVNVGLRCAQHQPTRHAHSSYTPPMTKGQARRLALVYVWLRPTLAATWPR